MNVRLNHQRAAFTLIELVISTAVIAMILAVTLPAFLAFQQRQTLMVAAQQVRDLILETQNYALAPRSGEDGDGKPAGADLYRIVFINSRQSPGYVISEQTLDSPTTIWKTVRRGQLPHGIFFLCFPATLDPQLQGALPVIYTDLTDEPLPASQDDRGLAYSISRLAKLVKVGPVSSGTLPTVTPLTTGQVKLVIGQQSLNEFYEVIVQVQTGRIDVLPTIDPTVCV